jgi:Sulfocyanin (SoxE) domain
LLRIRAALLSLVIAASAAACGSAAVAPTFRPTPVAAATPLPSPVAIASAPVVVAAAVPAKAIIPSLSLYEWKVIAPSTIKPGKFTYTISNFGTIQHELLVFKSPLDPASYPTDASGHIKEVGAGVTLVSDGENIDPSGSQVRTIDLKPGKYLFVCNIPGHFKAGMFTVVTVAP